jgi:hypothetical protein
MSSRGNLLSVLILPVSLKWEMVVNSYHYMVIL